MTEQVERRAIRDKVARLIMLDHLQLLSDFDVDGDIYRKDPECAASAYSTADAIIAALTVTPQEAAKVSAEDREKIVDEIESIICETHEMDVRDIDYAENIVSWLERHHPAALRAISEDSQ
ncbi:MAG: hypothetical protein ABJL49_05585 [Parasphingorhabdus sp.]|uniref:hypothetical protein n=1 Tax=Alphaproteobacteria TaxID=28211 RepID=UPI003265785A